MKLTADSKEYLKPHGLVCVSFSEKMNALLNNEIFENINTLDELIEALLRFKQQYNEVISEINKICGIRSYQFGKYQISVYSDFYVKAYENGDAIMETDCNSITDVVNTVRGYFIQLRKSTETPNVRRYVNFNCRFVVVESMGTYWIVGKSLGPDETAQIPADSRAIAEYHTKAINRYISDEVFDEVDDLVLLKHVLHLIEEDRESFPRGFMIPTMGHKKIQMPSGTITIAQSETSNNYNVDIKMQLHASKKITYVSWNNLKDNLPEYIKTHYLKEEV